MTSILGTSVCLRTLTLVMKSLQFMSRMVLMEVLEDLQVVSAMSHDSEPAP